MILIIYPCDKNELLNILSQKKLPLGSYLDKYRVQPDPDELRSFSFQLPTSKTFRGPVGPDELCLLTIALSGYTKPNPNKSYIIFKKSVLKEAKYWAPRWNSIYTSDKHRHYYDSNKSISYNLNQWVNEYEKTIDGYNPKFTYNEIGIPQNEIVFDKPIDLCKYVDWIIF